MDMTEQMLRDRIKGAMIEKRNTPSVENTAVYNTLKNILTRAQNLAKEAKTEVNEEFIVSAAKTERKQITDFVEAVKGVLDTDKQAEVDAGLSVVNEILPKETSAEEIEKFVTEHKADANNIGSMMRLLKAQFGDSLNGKVANGIVKTLLK